MRPKYKADFAIVNLLRLRTVPSRRNLTSGEIVTTLSAASRSSALMAMHSPALILGQSGGILMSILDRDHIVAPMNYNRWLVPPAALCVHLCIGQAYAFSVFNLPMNKLIGITEPAPDDWSIPALGWIFSIAIVFLGLSAAFAGTWLDRVGP